MVIRLGQGFWVDASDGLNWVLMRDKEGRKHPETVGFCSNLARAMRLAVERGMHEAPDDVPLAGVDAVCDQVARDILSEVVISTVRDKHFGLVKHFTVKQRQKPLTASGDAGMAR